MTDPDKEKVVTTHGNVYLFGGVKYSVERIVLYVCLTIAFVSWILSR